MNPEKVLLVIDIQEIMWTGIGCDSARLCTTSKSCTHAQTQKSKQAIGRQLAQSGDYNKKHPHF
ncbi:hypothetical protein CN246_07730 [Ethanoligenens harbinense]|nr:hypothetical protein CN246_07730 [Ethanoligenens harbinense]